MLADNKKMMKKISLMVFVMGIMMFALIGNVNAVMSSSTQIIQQGDSQYQYMAPNYNNDSFNFYFHNYSNPFYGSFDKESWSVGNMSLLNENNNRVVSWNCWRFNQDFTGILGSPDGFYMNDTLENWCYTTGDFIVREGQDDVNGYYAQLPAGFMLFDFGQAYNYSYPQPNRLFKDLYTDENLSASSYLYTANDSETSISFNGVNQSAQVSYSLLNNTRFLNGNLANISVSFWMNPLNTTGLNHDPLGMRRYSNINNRGGWWMSMFDTVGQENVLKQQVQKAGSGNASHIQTSVDFGVWTYITAIFEGNDTGVNLYLYKNGNLVNSTSISNIYTATTLTDMSGFALGMEGASAQNHFWNGSLDEVRLYNYSLSQSEIDTLYKSGRYYNPQILNVSLVAYYPIRNENVSLLMDGISLKNGTTQNITSLNIKGSLSLTRAIDCSINNITKYLVSANVTLYNILTTDKTNAGNLSIRINNNLQNLTVNASSFSASNVPMNLSFNINPSWLVCGDNNITIVQTGVNNYTSSYKLLASTNYNGYTYTTNTKVVEAFFDIYMMFNRTAEWSDSLKKGADFKVTHLNDGITSWDTCKLLWKNANWGAYDLASMSLMYDIFHNASYQNFVTNASECARRYYYDGLFGERNDEIMAATSDIENTTTKKENGISSNYFHIAMRGFAEAYARTGNADLQYILNSSLHLISSVATKGSHYLPPSPSSRYNTMYSFDSVLPNDYQFFIMNNTSFNPFVDTINYLSRTNFSTSTADQNFRNNGGMYIRAFQTFKTATMNDTYDIDKTGRYLRFFNATDTGDGKYIKLTAVKTGEYYALMSTSGATPAGGIITTLQRLSDGKILITANGSHWDGGLGNLWRTPFGVLRSSGYDTRAKMIVLNDSYPYKLLVTGNFRSVNISTSGTWNTTYTFYDNYIQIEQHTSTPANLDITPLSQGDIGNGTINVGSVRVIDGLVIAPMFNMTYNNTDQGSAWGNADIISAESPGMDFSYYVGIGGDDYVCKGNTTCLLNVNISNWQGVENLTFISGKESTGWFQWLVNGIEKLVGMGQNVFSYVFNVPIGGNATVTLNVNGTDGTNTTQTFIVTTNATQLTFYDNETLQQIYPSCSVNVGSINASNYYSGRTGVNPTLRCQLLNYSRGVWDASALSLATNLSMTKAKLRVYFDQVTSGVIEYVGGGIVYTTLMNFTRNMSEFPAGQVYITYGSSQSTTFYNDLMTDITKTLTIRTTNIAQQVKVSDNNQPLLKAYVVARVVMGDGTLNDAYSSYTDVNGLVTLSLQDNLYYQIDVQKDGYQNHSQIYWIAPANTNTILINMIRISAPSGSRVVTSSCQSKIGSAQNCSFLVQDYKVSNITYNYTWMNMSYSVLTQKRNATLTLLADNSSVPIYVSVYIDGVLIKTFTVQYEDLGARQIGLNFNTASIKGDTGLLVLFYLIVFIVGIIIAVTVNKFPKMQGWGIVGMNLWLLIIALNGFPLLWFVIIPAFLYYIFKEFWRDK